MRKPRSYVFPRGHGFIYRRDVPKRWHAAIGKSAWWISLSADSRAKAEQLGRAHAAQHDAILDRLNRFGATDAIRLQIANIEANTASVIREIEKAFFVVPRSQEELLDLEVRRGWEMEDAQEATARLRTRALKVADAKVRRLPAPHREAIAQAGGVAQAHADYEASRVALRFMDAAAELGGDNGIRTHEAPEGLTEEDEALHLARIIIEERKNREFEEDRRATAANMERLQGVLAPTGLVLPPAPAKRYSPSPSSPDTVSAVFEKWLSDQSQRPETARKWRVYQRRFTDIHGDVPVRSVTKAMVREYVETVATLPDSRGLKPDLRAGSVHDLLAWADGEDEVQHVSAATVTKHLDCMKAFFRWASRRDLTDINPARDIDPPKDNRPESEDVRPFTPDELQKIVATAEAEWKTTDDRYWLLMAAIYTGARREELAQLGKNNLEQHGDRWFLRIDDKDGRRVKNPSSIRVVPVHTKLIEHGFLVHVAKNLASPLLFPSMVKSKTGYYGHKMGAAFSRLLREKAGIVDKTVRWHSIRHSFADACREAVPEDIRHRLMGHTGANRIAEGYGKGHRLETLAQHMELVKPLGNT